MRGFDPDALDRWIQDGKSHTCDRCGRTWWDVDGGCDYCDEEEDDDGDEDPVPPE